MRDLIERAREELARIDPLLARLLAEQRAEERDADT